MPHRIAFLGFGDFERKALASYFRLAQNRSPAYEHVGSLTDADFLVADADHAPSVSLVQVIERMAETVFIGAQAPEGARSWLARPIDALRVMRALDALVARTQTQGPTQASTAATPRADTQEAGAAALAPAHPLLGDLPFNAPLPAPPTPPTSPAAITPAAREVAPGAAPGAGPTGLHGEPQAFRQPAASSLLQPSDSPLPPAAATPRKRRPPALSASSPPPPPPPPPAPALPPRVLVVDDSAIAQRFLETRLARWQLQVDRASTSQAASALLARHSYEVVFLDVDLGEASELDGHALCQRIKQTPTLLSTMVIIVSAFHTELDRVRAALAGCDAFLPKPLELPELQRLLDRQGLPLAAPEGATPAAPAGLAQGAAQP